jgi:hypothetical protein
MAAALNSDEEYLSRLTENEFGKTVLQTLQVTMRQGGENSAGRILDLLKQMQLNIGDEETAEG